MAKVKEKKEKKAKEPKPKKEKKVKLKKVKEQADGSADAQGGMPKAPKPKVPADLYTLVLLFAWLALTAACVLAYLDLASYK